MKKYPIDIFLKWIWYQFILLGGLKSIPHSSRTSVYTFIMEVNPLHAANMQCRNRETLHDKTRTVSYIWLCWLGIGVVNVSNDTIYIILSLGAVDSLYYNHNCKTLSQSPVHLLKNPLYHCCPRRYDKRRHHTDRTGTADCVPIFALYGSRIRPLSRYRVIDLCTTR